MWCRTPTDLTRRGGVRALHSEIQVAHHHVAGHSGTSIHFAKIASCQLQSLCPSTSVPGDPSLGTFLALEVCIDVRKIALAVNRTFGANQTQCFWNCYRRNCGKTFDCRALSGGRIWQVLESTPQTKKSSPRSLFPA